MAIKIGLVGTGTVGSGCVNILNKHSEMFKKTYGVDLQLVKVCSREPEQARALGLEDIFTENYMDLVTDDSIDIIIELIGGTTHAYELVKAALKAGKNIVTANKALLATYGSEISALANEVDKEVLFEASVGGGIAVLEPLQNSLRANDIHTVMGIVNGTTNYMLTRMANEGLTYDEVLSVAQDLGFAEADPTADVDGHDAAAKIAILATLAFNKRVGIKDVYTEGIRNISPLDQQIAADMGYVIKLVAQAHKTDAGIDVRVHPTMLPLNHQLSKVDGVFNAIFMIGDFVGETMFFGEGAGSGPAASAVMGDVIQMARRITAGGQIIPPAKVSEDATIRSIEELEMKYYIRFAVSDKPGVLAEMASVFAKHGVSVHSVIQRGQKTNDSVALNYLTHGTTEKAVRSVLEEILNLEGVVKADPILIRVGD